jgi:hypothetical protein
LLEVGLNYAAEPAVTKHLANFLRQAAATSGEGAFARPTHLLLNGGVLQSKAIEQRLLAVLNSWLNAVKAPPVTELRSHNQEADLMHAVALGAAYYGLAKTGKGVRIRGGVPRTYYVGIESSMPAVPGMPAPMKALAVVPFGLEEGSRVELPQRRFALVVGEPAEFRFFSSRARKTDQPGTLLEEIGDDLEELTALVKRLCPLRSKATSLKQVSSSSGASLRMAVAGSSNSTYASGLLHECRDRSGDHQLRARLYRSRRSC